MIFQGFVDYAATPASVRGAQLRIASACRPSMTAQRVPNRVTQTTAVSQLQLNQQQQQLGLADDSGSRTGSCQKDGVAKTLRFIDDDDDVDDSPTAAKRPLLDEAARASADRERRLSGDGEQTKIQFRQRKLARSPGGGAAKRNDAETQRLKAIEKREKAMELKIHLQKLKAKKNETSNENESNEDVSSELVDENRCPFTMMTSEDIDDVIGLTTSASDGDDAVVVVTSDVECDDVVRDSDDDVDADVDSDVSDGDDVALENLTLDQLNQSIIDCGDELIAITEKMENSRRQSSDRETMKRLLEKQAQRQATILARQAKLENILAKLVKNRPDVVLVNEETTPSSGSSAFKPVNTCAQLTNAQMTLVRSVVKPNAKRSALVPINALAPPTNHASQSSSPGNGEKSDWLKKLQDLPLFRTNLPLGLANPELATIAASLLDEEVRHYTRSGPIRGLVTCDDRPRDPIGRSLMFGDDKHFVPVHAVL